MARVMFARCEPCMYDDCPGGAHTWMGESDAAHAGLAWPLASEEAADRPCACRCAGGPGGCVPIAEVPLPTDPAA